MVQQTDRSRMAGEFLSRLTKLFLKLKKYNEAVNVINDEIERYMDVKVSGIFVDLCCFTAHFGSFCCWVFTFSFVCMCFANFHSKKTKEVRNTYVMKCVLITIFSYRIKFWMRFSEGEHRYEELSVMWFSWWFCNFCCIFITSIYTCISSEILILCFSATLPDLWTLRNLAVLVSWLSVWCLYNLHEGILWLRRKAWQLVTGVQLAWFF